MAYELYKIIEFERAMFNGDRSIMNEETFNVVYTEYVDTAELYESEEFTKVSYINYLNGRVNTIKLAISVQKSFLEEFGVGCEAGFKLFAKYGYTVYWNKNTTKEEFIKVIERIERSEYKYISQVENEIKELHKLRESKGRSETPEKPNRGSWIKMINSLGKNGYKIDKYLNTVEELSWMIKQQMDDSKNY